MNNKYKWLRLSPLLIMAATTELYEEIIPPRWGVFDLYGKRQVDHGFSLMYDVLIDLWCTPLGSGSRLRIFGKKRKGKLFDE